MWFDKDRQVYVIDCHRCRPTDLPEHAKPKRRYISAQRLGSLLLIVRDAPGPITQTSATTHRLVVQDSCSGRLQNGMTRGRAF
jgi:hypothetical protein